MHQKRGQISTEYLIIAGFVLFVVLGIAGLAFTYSSSMSEQTTFNNLNTFANKLISSAESMYYYGEPAQETIQLYLPKNIKEITLSNKDLIFNVSTSSGNTRMSFTSKVPLNGSITTREGIKVLKLTATRDSVMITE